MDLIHADSISSLVNESFLRNIKVTEFVLHVLGVSLSKRDFKRLKRFFFHYLILSPKRIASSIYSQINMIFSIGVQFPLKRRLHPHSISQIQISLCFHNDGPNEYCIGFHYGMLEFVPIIKYCWEIAELPRRSGSRKTFFSCFWTIRVCCRSIIHYRSGLSTHPISWLRCENMRTF